MSAPTAQPSTAVLFDDIDLREDKSESKPPSEDDNLCSTITNETPACGQPGHLTPGCSPPAPEKPYEQD